MTRQTLWDHATNAERAEECARFLAVHGFIEVSECRRIFNEARERAEGEAGAGRPQSPRIHGED